MVHRPMQLHEGKRLASPPYAWSVRSTTSSSSHVRIQALFTLRSRVAKPKSVFGVPSLSTTKTIPMVKKTTMVMTMAVPRLVDVPVPVSTSTPTRRRHKQNLHSPNHNFHSSILNTYPISDMAVMAVVTDWMLIRRAHSESQFVSFGALLSMFVLS